MRGNWPRSALGEVLRVVDSAVPSSRLEEVQLAGVYSFGRGLFKRGLIRPSNTTYKAYNRLVAGDFVISQPKAWEGALARVTPEFDGWFLSPVFPTFRPDPQHLDPQFLEWYCRQAHVWHQLRAGARGMGARRESVSAAQFLSLTIPLPPLSEQRRVVAMVDKCAAAADEAINLRGQARSATQRLWAAELQGVVDDLAVSYPVTTLAALQAHVTSGPRNLGGRYGSGELRLYRAQDVGPNGELTNLFPAFVSLFPGRQGRSAVLTEGDLMIVITGATVGRVAVFGPGCSPGLVSQHVALCRFPHARIEPAYALYYLRSPQGQGQMLGQRYGQGKPGLNLTQVGALTIPLPPVPEQRRIVARLQEQEAHIRRIQEAQESSASRLGALLPSLLDSAFNGDL